MRGYIQYPFIKTNARACFGAGHCQGVPASRLALECHLPSRAYGSKVVGPVSGVLMPVVQEVAALQPALTAAAVARLVIAKLVLVPVRPIRHEVLNSDHLGHGPPGWRLLDVRDKRVLIHLEIQVELF